jgi:hypothetical protein
MAFLKHSAEYTHIQEALEKLFVPAVKLYNKRV